MMTKIFIGIVAVLWIIGCIIMIVELFFADEGYQDDKGYHVGKEPPVDT